MGISNMWLCSFIVHGAVVGLLLGDDVAAVELLSGGCLRILVARASLPDEYGDTHQRQRFSRQESGLYV
jgi:hypothetical protein